MTGIITDIQRFSIHDGPGIRTNVYFKGCNMKCSWCHNPESIEFGPELMFHAEKCIGCGECLKACKNGVHTIIQGERILDRAKCIKCGNCTDACYSLALEITGKKMTAQEVLEEVIQDKEFYDSSSGGVTITGGEPLMQINFLYEILEKCKKSGIHTGVETNLSSPWHLIEKILPVVDLFMFDIKSMDDKVHRNATGISIKQIKNNALKLSSTGKPLIIRTPVVKGVNDDAANIKETAKFIKDFENLKYYELLSYHNLGSPKYESLGKKYAAKEVELIGKNTILQLAGLARKQGVITKTAYDEVKVHESSFYDMQKNNYNQRMELMKRKKLLETKDKIKKYGFLDQDDYGNIVPPEDFEFNIIPNHENKCFYGASAWAENFYILLSKYPAFVDSANAIAGRWMFTLSSLRKIAWNPEYSFSHLVDEQEKYNIVHGIGNDSHFAPDYKIGLSLGWDGILDKIKKYRKIGGKDKSEFYDAQEKVVMAIKLWISNTIDEIRRKIETEKDTIFKENLQEMLEVNEWIIVKPPRTLREACQWVAWYNMASRIYNRDGAGGRLDELLRPYYEKDIENGIIEDEDAIFYIFCLLINETHYYQLSGSDTNGNDLTSHMSYLILEAAGRLDSTANLTIALHDKIDRKFFQKSVEYLMGGQKGWPRYSGEKSLADGFMKNGFDVETAKSRIAVGCNWMAIPGREYTMNDTVKINIAKVFEVAFYHMYESDGADISLKKLWELFSYHLKKAVLCTAKGIDWQLKYQKYSAPELMINLLCYGPIEKGMDSTDGGLEFYNMGVDGAGLATVADSFAAIEQRVVAEHVLNWRELYDHIKNDFKTLQGETVRLMLKKSQKFGQGSSLGDKWAGKITELFTDTVKEDYTPGGRNLIPGWFSWSNTIEFGQVLGATPNGRNAGKPISHGANPDPGFRRDNAPTALAKAIAAVQPAYGNTAPMQIELDPGSLTDKNAVINIMGLLKTHVELGGTLININIVDADKIRRAHKNPSAYPDLVVRVTGFTAYFATLSPEFRQLVVDRLIG